MGFCFFLLGIPLVTTSSAIGLKISAINVGIKKYKSIIKKKKKKHDEIVLLAKFKLSSTEVLISKVLINSYISHGDVILGNNALKDYDHTKGQIKNLKTYTIHQRF